MTDISGDDASAMLKAILLHHDFADCGVEDSPAARDLWQDIARSVDALPEGMSPDIPHEWPDERAPGRGTKAGGADPKVRGGSPRHNHVTRDIKPPGVCPGCDFRAVGPKGYIHGWIFVGAPFPDSRVYHPSHGHGTVTHVDDQNRVHVKFDKSGAVHSFEHRHEPARKKPKFEKRPIPSGEPTWRSNPGPPMPKPSFRKPPLMDRFLGKWFTNDVAPHAKDALETIFGKTSHRWSGETFTEKNDVWNGLMEWGGRMGMDPIIARNAASILDPNNSDDVRRVQGVKVFLHELHHSVGSDRGDKEKTKLEAQDYMTKPGHDVEEGYTELGAWLNMPAFLKAMGVDHKMVLTRDGTTKVPIGQLFETWNDPLTFTGHSTVSDNVSYLPHVKSAYEWLEGIQNIEGYDGNQYSHDRMKRITELSNEVNKVSGPAKWDAMVNQYLRAKNITIPDTSTGHTARKALADSLAVNWDMTSPMASTGQPGVMLALANRLDQLKQYGYLEKT